MWNCQNTNGKRYVSAFSGGGKSSLYLKHKVEQKGLHLSDTFDTYGTQWMGKDLNGTLLLQQTVEPTDLSSYQPSENNCDNNH